MSTEKAAESRAAKKPGKPGIEPIDRARWTRRQVTWLGVFGYIGACLLGTAKFFFPRVLYEPKNEFKIGYPGDFPLGVDTKFQQSQRIWVVREPARLFVILAKCTHLGCTPDWKETERKFKCPCHGSGFDMAGQNFEGPAPRPLERVKVSLAPDGQILVNKGVAFPFEKWNEKDAYITL